MSGVEEEPLREVPSHPEEIRADYELRLGKLITVQASARITPAGVISAGIAAAAIILAVGVWGVFYAIKSGKVSTSAPQAQLDANTQVLTVGLGDHLHCSIDRDFAIKRISDEEMSAKLGD